jgi:hypothetical protein
MSTCNVRARWTIAFAAAALLHAGQAAAQTSAQDQATARALFIEARQLMKAGRYPEACVKFESASRLFEGSGLLLNLGDCYEHLGRTASAWTEFGAAIAASERAGRADDAAEARRRQSALEPRLSRLRIRVKVDAPELVVRRDGSELARGAWGEAVPVDPGQHVVTAEWPEGVAWRGAAVVSEPGATVTVEVPELHRAPSPARPQLAPPTEPAAAPGYWTGRRIAAASQTTLGALGMVAGGVIALVAKTKDATAETETTNRHADSISATNLGNVATVVVGVSAVVTAAGFVLWLTAPDARVQVGAAPLLVAGSFP